MTPGRQRSLQTTGPNYGFAQSVDKRKLHDNENIRVSSMFSQAYYVCTIKAQLQHLQGGCTSSNDGDRMDKINPEQIQPRCKNRMRSTTKCRRMCCRKKQEQPSTDGGRQMKLGGTVVYCVRGCCQQVPGTPYKCLLTATTPKAKNR